MSELSRQILKTLTFFDVQELPLTLIEIKSYLGISATLLEIEETIQNDLRPQIHSDGVFYYLAGRQDMVSRRHAKYQTSLKRFRKAKKILYFMRFLPFVRGVAISGSQAILNSREDSDIDLFIITAKRRIWIARLFVTTYLQLLGQRRHGRFTKNRFCLNHYIEQDRLIERDKNLYTAILYSNFLPVFGIQHFKDFYKVNGWINQFISSPISEQSNSFFGYQTSFVQKLEEWLLEIIFIAPLLNSIGRLYQKGRIKEQTYVFVSDQELSFHPDSKGQQILAKYREKSNLT